YQVRVLGGADVAEKLLGYVPANWEVIPFGGEDPAIFLKEIDFWVYMHHPDLKEAFGRAAMEALAAGCVAVMPPYMQELFGDAALYAKPDGVQQLVDEYSADLDKFLTQSRRAQEFAREFSPEMHLQRLYELGVQQPST
ncbi:glycosyltransferase family 1 protein, partial [Cereibacter sphaeroides]|uniref:glycosyltransferase n=1 Tax=Cereibacter sphaeroides TaxID=1063 RepID=UPI000EDAB032